jgi:hypothetical protein
MSKLVYDHLARTLTLFDRDGAKIGVWQAGNHVDSSVGRPRLPTGDYRFQGHNRHGAGGGDTSSGKFGPMGIFVLRDFTYLGKKHSGVGVHSGRENTGGPEHATMLCVRTTDVAMSMIHLTAMQDPLETLTVQDGERHAAVTAR